MPMPVGAGLRPGPASAPGPDIGVQDAIRPLFAAFARTGSAPAVVVEFTRRASVPGPRAHRRVQGRAGLDSAAALGGCCAPAQPRYAERVRLRPAPGTRQPQREEDPSTRCPATSGFAARCERSASAPCARPGTAARRKRRRRRPTPCVRGLRGVEPRDTMLIDVQVRGPDGAISARIRNLDDDVQRRCDGRRGRCPALLRQHRREYAAGLSSRPPGPASMTVPRVTSP